jgi:hypothetical protein
VWAAPAARVMCACDVGGRPGGVDSQAMVEEHAEQATYFENWYADMTGASVKD